MKITKKKAILIGILLLVGGFLLKDTLITKQATDIDWDKRLETLRSIPYISFSETVGDNHPNVVMYNPDKVYNGYNIYCSRISPEAFLMDMMGNVVHRWSYPPEYDLKEDDGVWDYAIMLDNGDLVVISKFRELIRLNWDSELLWKKKMEVHHEVALTPENTFYVIVREIKTYRGVGVDFPVIVHLTSNGDEIERWAAYDHLSEIKNVFDQKSFLDTVFDNMSWFEVCKMFLKRGLTRIQGYDEDYSYFHMNAISILPDTALGRTDKRFQEGNLLICFRNVNQIAILDKNTKKVMWVWGEGVLEWPHHPTMLNTGNILIFDNGVNRKYSKVVELNPVTKTVVWEYVADPPESFYSYQKGSAQRLPNGNTLICEGDEGRVFEVTNNGEIVWAWLNPVTRDGHREQVYRMIRLSPDKVERVTSFKGGF
jgi:hypothetical protein